MAATTLVHLARVQQALGQSSDALATVRRAIALAESFVEKGAPSYLIGLARLAEADLLAGSGAADQARTAYRIAFDNLRPTLGTGHSATQSAERALR